jgi:two-component system, OmpR family, response regulator VicR
MNKILLVEDDPNLGQILSEYLQLKGYAPVLCGDGEEALSMYRKQQFDLCLLDIMMPKKDGFTLAREIRTIDKTLPIIFLTAKTLKDDAIEGFRIGADDYITKPFSMEELLLRITAVLRRSSPLKGGEDKVFHIGSFKFNFDDQTLSTGIESLKLTTKEAHLLKLLCQNKNMILNRSAALKMIWGDDSYFNARSMDVYITKLRKYLKADDRIIIMTVHGEGFKLIEKA